MKYLHFALVFVLTTVLLCGYIPARPTGPVGEMVIPPDSSPRIEWATYPVGGMVLVNPAVEDSSGNYQMVRLPAGTLISIPYMPPDSTRSRQDQS